MNTGLDASSSDNLFLENLSVDEVLYRSKRTIVLRASLPREGRTIVLKRALNVEGHRRLRHETAILRRLADVEGVIQIAPAPDQLNTLALQDIGAVPLIKWMQQRPIAIPDVVFMGKALADVLARVHHAGVIHKDINPTNILIDGTKLRPTLIDFNISSGVAEELPSFAHQSQIAGTLRYMAPEQTGRVGRAVDTRTDLYSLGVLMYEMTVGRPPFESNDLLDLIRDHLARIPTIPQLARNPALKAIPSMLSDIIMQLLEKEPDRRYQSAQGLALDLSHLHQMLLRGDTTPFPLARHDFGRRLVPPTRPIGRDDEIGLLKTVLDRAIEGQSRCLLVSGTPGVGKTVLVNELRPMVAKRRGWFVSGKFDQYRKDAPTATVQALRALGRLLLAEPEQQLAVQRDRLLRGLGSNSGFGAAALPEFAILLGPQSRVDVTDPREAEVRLNQTTLDLIRSIASPGRPVVVLLDDLQWAPPVTLLFLDALISAERSIPGLLVVGSFRVNEVDAMHPLHVMMAQWSQSSLSPEQLNLTNLDERDVSTLVAQMLRLPNPQATRLAAALRARTQGNPYDTVEFINALRQDGLLTPRDGQWDWDATSIHRYVGNASMEDILNQRVSKLPVDTREILELMACLGGNVSHPVLALASGLVVEELTNRIVPALEDGLLLIEQGETTLLHFRHDRVQQAVFEGMTKAHRSQLHLRLARQLAQQPELNYLAAEQYLPVMTTLIKEDECRAVVSLFQQAASRSSMLNYVVAERFLTAAIKLLKPFQTHDDTSIISELKVDHHRSLYSLGRLEEGDLVYLDIVKNISNPIELAEPAGIQMYSLTNRGRHSEALTLGLRLLAELGLSRPVDLDSAIESSRQRLVNWYQTEQPGLDFDKPEAVDQRTLACAKLIIQTSNASFFSDSPIFNWLVLEGHRLWREHGPCAQIMASMFGTPFMIIDSSQNYRDAYRVCRHLMAVGALRGYRDGTSSMLTTYGIAIGHWIEPIEAVIQDLRKAREELLRVGDFVFTSYTYAAVDLLFDCSSTLDVATDETEMGVKAADRTRNHDLKLRYQLRRNLIRTLAGEATAVGSSPVDPPDGISSSNIYGAVYHITRTISAAIFGDTPALIHHASLAMPMLGRTPGYYLTAIARVLQALSLAEQARALPLNERAPLLQELDVCLHWLTLRAVDAPMNFLHLQHWIEAERAWAGGDIWQAGAKFDTALHTVAQVTRPWHQALITERTGLFHSSQGMDKSAQRLLTQACSLYEAWGASGKVRALQGQYSYLQRQTDLRHAQAGVRSTTGTSLSTDTVDMLAVLRASQALSSETSLSRLTERLGDVLGAMTGASAVHLLVQPEDRPGWFLAASLGADASPVSVEQAGEQGELALSVFRYAQRTQETLLLEDATQDDRFNRDPYVAALAQCSILCAPVLSHGELRAMLMLESRQRRGAFSAERLDAVLLIAGQMAVSLDNALLYASLEQRVQQRTEKLAQANTELAQALQTLERTKDELVRSEKLAALGSLVAGVAHELNTPIGNGLTVASSLEFKTGEFIQAAASGLKRSSLDQYLKDTRFAADILVRNLGRASELISSFKQVAVDQTSSQRRKFELHEVVSEIVLTLSPSIRHSGCTVNIDVSAGLKFDSYPGPLGQVLSNLINNAMIHGYADGPGGVIEVQARMLNPQEVELSVRDHGRGVQEANLKRIFEPFYTTRLGQGGSGLGLHIVHNIVTGALGGRVDVHSSPGQGMLFTLTLPLRAPEAV